MEIAVVKENDIAASSMMDLCWNDYLMVEQNSG